MTTTTAWIAWIITIRYWCRILLSKKIVKGRTVKTLLLLQVLRCQAFIKGPPKIKVGHRLELPHSREWSCSLQILPASRRTVFSTRFIRPSPFCFCILQAIKNRSQGRPGNEARRDCVGQCVPFHAYICVVPKPVTVVIGLEMKLDVHMRTRLNKFYYVIITDLAISLVITPFV